MLTFVGVALFAVAIMFSIAWHELGHLIPAKKFGVKCTQFMVGFGPTLKSWRRGETEYGVKAIPLGGYVRMVGMFPPGPDGAVGEQTTGRFAQLIAETRRDSQAELVTEQDRQRAFYNLSVPKKITVMMGGPVMNLILAAVLFAVALVGFGTPTPTLVADRITPCIPTSANPSGAQQDGVCTDGASPAAAAGLQPGDEIVAFDGQPVQDWESLSAQIRSSSGPQQVEVVRDGQEQTLTVDIAQVNRPVVSDGQATGQTAVQGFLGMGPEIALEPQPLSAVPGRMWEITAASAKALVTLPVRMIDVGQAALGQEPRDPNGPVGVVGVGRISGELAAAQDVPVSWKAAQFILLIASLNLFLFLFNLIPLLPLDGGHVAGALYEGARRRWAQWRGKADPGPFDVAKLMPLAYSVAILLIVMSAVLVYADVVAPIRLS